MKTMTLALESILGKVENDIKKGKNMSPVFSSAEKANEYLDTLNFWTKTPFCFQK